MNFFSLLIVLALLQLWGSGGPVQRDQWFFNYCKKSSAWLPAGNIRLVFLVAMPVLLVLLLQGLLGSILFGLPLLIMTVVVLLYSLGRGNYSDSLMDYLNAWSQGNFESAYEQAMAIGDFKQSESIGDHQSLHEHARKAYIYQGFERWFVVVFWFLLLGPAAALAYRLMYLLARADWVGADERQLALRWLYYLDWLPARLLAFSFSLTGDFVNAFNQSWQQFFTSQPSADFLDDCAVAALQSGTVKRVYPVDQALCIDYGREELLALQSLLSRSMICWVVIVAVLTILS